MAVWLVFVPGLGHEAEGRGAEPDDGQADGHAGAHGRQGLQGGGQQRGGQQPLVALAHVQHDGFHLEVRAQDPAHMENLVAVPCKEARRPSRNSPKVALKHSQGLGGAPAREALPPGITFLNIYSV